MRHEISHYTRRQEDGKILPKLRAGRVVYNDAPVPGSSHNRHDRRCPDIAIYVQLLTIGLIIGTILGYILKI